MNFLRHKPVVLFLFLFILLNLLLSTYTVLSKQLKTPPQPTTSESRRLENDTKPIPTKKDANFKTYESKQYVYKVAYPSTWDIKEAIAITGVPLTPTWFGSILQENEIQKVSFLEKEYKAWQGMFQIIVLNNHKKQNLDQWAKEYTVPLATNPKTNLAKTIGDAQLGGEPAKKFSIFSFDREELAIATIHNGLVYYITFTGKNPNDPDKETHDKIYNQILSSFTFIN